MSDKKLLEEQTIRRFMKLANIDGLADNFVENNTGVIKEGKGSKRSGYVVDQRKGEEGRAADRMKEGMDSEEGMEKPMYEAEDDMGGDDMDLGGDDLEVGGGEGNEELFKKVVEAVAGAMGVDASIEGDEGGGEDMDMDMGDEEGEEEEEGGEEDEEDEEEDEGLMEGACSKCGKSPCECEEEEEDEGKKMDEQLAEAVLTRVKARLMAEAKAAKMKAMKGAGGKGKIAAKKAAKKGMKAGAKMEEAAKGGHATGKAAAMNFGIKGGGKKGVGNVAKSSAKKGNMTPAKKSTKHTK